MIKPTFPTPSSHETIEGLEVYNSVSRSLGAAVITSAVEYDPVDLNELRDRMFDTPVWVNDLEGLGKEEKRSRKALDSVEKSLHHEILALQRVHEKLEQGAELPKGISLHITPLQKIAQVEKKPLVERGRRLPNKLYELGAPDQAVREGSLQVLDIALAKNGISLFTAQKLMFRQLLTGRLYRESYDHDSELERSTGDDHKVHAFEIHPSELGSTQGIIGRIATLTSVRQRTLLNEFSPEV